MRLCNYTVKIDIPDGLLIQQQDKALDKVDEIGLRKQIETHVQKTLESTHGLKLAVATVED